MLKYIININGKFQMPVHRNSRVNGGLWVLLVVVAYLASLSAFAETVLVRLDRQVQLLIAVLKPETGDFQFFQA